MQNLKHLLRIYPRLFKEHMSEESMKVYAMLLCCDESIATNWKSTLRYCTS